MGLAYQPTHNSSANSFVSYPSFTLGLLPSPMQRLYAAPWCCSDGMRVGMIGIAHF